MQIRRAALNSIEQHFVDKADNWGIVSVYFRLFLLFCIDLDIKINITKIQPTGTVIQILINGVMKFVILNQYGFGSQPRAELNVIDRLLIGRVGYTNKELVAAFGERSMTFSSARG